MDDVSEAEEVLALEDSSELDEELSLEESSDVDGELSSLPLEQAESRDTARVAIKARLLLIRYYLLFQTDGVGVVASLIEAPQ